MACFRIEEITILILANNSFILNENYFWIIHVLLAQTNWLFKSVLCKEVNIKDEGLNFPTVVQSQVYGTTLPNCFYSLTDARLSLPVFNFFSSGVVILSIAQGISKMHRCQHPTLLSITSGTVTAIGREGIFHKGKNAFCSLKTIWLFTVRCFIASIIEEVAQKK